MYVIGDAVTIFLAPLKASWKAFIFSHSQGTEASLHNQ